MQREEPETRMVTVIVSCFRRPGLVQDEGSTIMNRDEHLTGGDGERDAYALREDQAIKRWRSGSL